MWTYCLVSDKPACISYATDLYKLIEEDYKFLRSAAEQVRLYKWPSNDVDSLQYVTGRRHAPRILACQRVHVEEDGVHKAL